MQRRMHRLWGSFDEEQIGTVIEFLERSTDLALACTEEMQLKQNVREFGGSTLCSISRSDLCYVTRIDGQARRCAWLASLAHPIHVPVRPSMPSLALVRSVISVVRPGLDAAKSTAASTFGNMEPFAKWPSRR